MAIPIVNLNNLIDSLVSNNVNVANANTILDEAVDKLNKATNLVHTTIDIINQAETLVNNAENAATTALTLANQVDRDKSLVADYLRQTESLKQDTFEYLVATNEKWDHFDDRYLGAYDADPITDNDGNALIEGAVYWNMLKRRLRVWNGSNWQNLLTATGYLEVTNNLSDLSDKVLARANLGVDSSEEVSAKIREATLALGTTYTVANNNDKTLLKNLTVGDKIFVIDDGDGKWAFYLVTAVDSEGKITNSLVLMDEDTYLNANTAASIKSAYESNPNTNAFTDAEKTKLGYISVTNAIDLDAIAADVAINNTKVSNVTTDISVDQTYQDKVIIESSDGTDGVIQAAIPSSLGVGGIAGILTAQDKEKLDGIEVGATADQTAEEIEALYESRPNTNKYTNEDKIKINYINVTQPINLDVVKAEIDIINTKILSYAIALG